MASVVALLEKTLAEKFASRVTVGAVLPIDRYRAADHATFATELSHGGALYLVLQEKTKLLLVAVLETPERSGLKVGDKRKPGWYAPVNATPITDISNLRAEIGLPKKFGVPRILDDDQDRILREALDAADAPMVEHQEPAQKAAKLDPTLPPLHRALSYLAGNYVDEAIAALSEAWRNSHAPILANLIDRATPLQRRAHRPLFDKRIIDEGVWDAAFDEDPQAAMPQLLLNLGTGGYAMVPKRAKRLAELPLDPRFGARVIELLSMRPFGERTWYPPGAALWLKSKDARTFAALLELEALSENLGPATAKVYAMAKGPAPELAEADRPLVEQITAQLDRLEEPLRTEYALVDEIAAMPDDTEPYLVYADWLIERGRPLGEYIALTCQQRSGKLTPARARRLAQLGEVPYLCGVFDDLPATRLRKRERGLDRELSAYWSTQPRTWELVAASPLVRVIEKLQLVGSPRRNREDVIARFILGAPGLTKVSDLEKATATRLVEMLADFRSPHSFSVVKSPTGTMQGEYGGTTVPLYDLIRVDRSR